MQGLFSLHAVLEGDVGRGEAAHGEAGDRAVLCGFLREVVGGEVMEAVVVEVEAELTMGGEESAYTAESDSGYHYFNNDDIGDTVFLSREAALAMRKGNM